MTGQEHYTVAQVAELTGRTVGFLYRALKDGRVEGIREGYVWAIPASEVERLRMQLGGVVEPPPVHEGEEDGRDLPEDIERIVAEVGDQASRVSLFRKATSGHLAYLRGFSTDEFSLDTVADLYGGGAFVLKFLKSNGTYLTSTRFEIEGPSKVPPLPTASGTVPGAPVPAGQDSMGMMLTMFRETLLEIKEAIKEKSGGDPLEMAAKMAELIQGQTANAIEALKINQPSGGASFGVLDGIELFERAMSLGQSLAGEGGGDVVSQLGGEVISVLREKRQAEKEASGGARSLPAHSKGDSHQPAPPDASAPSWVPLMRPWVPQLIGWARAGKRVDLYADVVADNLPDAAAAFLAQQIPDPAFIESFYRQFPDCVPHRWWLDQMFAALYDVLVEEREEPALEEELDELGSEVVSSGDAASGRGPRNVSDLVDDAPAGESGGPEPLDDPGG